jgi:5-methylcytosine-specific restriction endonuclease McrA
VIEGKESMEKEKKDNEIIGITDLRAMLERQCYRCPLTGDLLTPENCAMDHIIPLCRGGSHIKSNAQLVTSDVNRAKGGLLEEEFIALCKKVVFHAKQKDL